MPRGQHAAMASTETNVQLQSTKLRFASPSPHTGVAQKAGHAKDLAPDTGCNRVTTHPLWDTPTPSLNSAGLCTADFLWNISRK